MSAVSSCWRHSLTINWFILIHPAVATVNDFRLFTSGLGPPTWSRRRSQLTMCNTSSALCHSVQRRPWSLTFARSYGTDRGLSAGHRSTETFAVVQLYILFFILALPRGHWPLDRTHASVCRCCCCNAWFLDPCCYCRTSDTSRQRRTSSTSVRDVIYTKWRSSACAYGSAKMQDRKMELEDVRGHEDPIMYSSVTWLQAVISEAAAHTRVEIQRTAGYWHRYCFPVFVCRLITMSIVA